MMKSAFLLKSAIFFMCMSVGAVAPLAGESLSKKKCIPCNSNIPPLTGDELQNWVQQLGGEWKLHGEHHIEKEYLFEDFVEALAFTNRVGAVAEENGHHPNILLSYGYVKLMLWTFKIDGLSESDFILAAKIDEL